jgi:hypothetical protein
VLHPPSGNYRWVNGRTYENMVPTFTLDHVITPDEAHAWRIRITRARDTDMFTQTNQTSTALR